MHRSNLEGQEKFGIAKADLGDPFGLDLDFLNKRLYWANNSKLIVEEPLRHFARNNCSFNESLDQMIMKHVLRQVLRQIEGRVCVYYYFVIRI